MTDCSAMFLYMLRHAMWIRTQKDHVNIEFLQIGEHKSFGAKQDYCVAQTSFTKLILSLWIGHQANHKDWEVFF